MSSRDAEDNVLGTVKFRWFGWAFLPSLALHGAAFASIGDARSWSLPENPPSEMSFVVTEKRAEPPPEPPKPPEPPPRAPESAPPAPRPIAESTPPPPEPSDLRGETLTNDASTFAMPVGNALPLDRPIVAGLTPAPSTSPTARAVLPVRTPPSLVKFNALGTRPAPPPLEGALRRNYPTDARRRALGGSATVRARIEGDGVARSVSFVNETGAGFGEACRRTLAGSRWSPPRDANGRAVSTEVRYTCHFKVD
jgi:protein TonB